MNLSLHPFLFAYRSRANMSHHTQSLSGSQAVRNRIENAPFAFVVNKLYYVLPEKIRQFSPRKTVSHCCVEQSSYPYIVENKICFDLPVKALQNSPFRSFDIVL